MLHKKDEGAGVRMWLLPVIFPPGKPSEPHHQPLLHCSFMAAITIVMGAISEAPAHLLSGVITIAET